LALDGDDGELVERVTRLFAGSSFVEVHPVHLWTFTRSLNTLVTRAFQLKASKVIFQSVEVSMEAPDVVKLLRRFTPSMVFSTKAPGIFLADLLT